MNLYFVQNLATSYLRKIRVVEILGLGSSGVKLLVFGAYQTFWRFATIPVYAIVTCCITLINGFCRLKTVMTSSLSSKFSALQQVKCHCRLWYSWYDQHLFELCRYQCMRCRFRIAYQQLAFSLLKHYISIDKLLK